MLRRRLRSKNPSTLRSHHRVCNHQDQQLLGLNPIAADIRFWPDLLQVARRLDPSKVCLDMQSLEVPWKVLGKLCLAVLFQVIRPLSTSQSDLPLSAQHIHLINSVVLSMELVMGTSLVRFRLLISKESMHIQLLVRL